MLARLQHQLTLALLGVSGSSLWTLDRYVKELEWADFSAEHISIRDITDRVFPGFARFLQSMGKGEERAWRGGGWTMLFGLRKFGNVVEKWRRGGDDGMVRCVLVMAEKDDIIKKR